MMCATLLYNKEWAPRMATARAQCGCELVGCAGGSAGVLFRHRRLSPTHARLREGVSFQAGFTATAAAARASAPPARRRRPRVGTVRASCLYRRPSLACARMRLREPVSILALACVIMMQSCYVVCVGTMCAWCAHVPPSCAYT